MKDKKELDAGPSVTGALAPSLSKAQEPEIDLERAVNDPAYRRAVIQLLNDSDDNAVQPSGHDNGFKGGSSL